VQASVPGPLTLPIVQVGPVAVSGAMAELDWWRVVIRSIELFSLVAVAEIQCREDSTCGWVPLKWLLSVSRRCRAGGHVPTHHVFVPHGNLLRASYSRHHTIRVTVRRCCTCGSRQHGRGGVRPVA
jgi:hypothetical protein